MLPRLVVLRVIQELRGPLIGVGRIPVRARPRGDLDRIARLEHLEWTLRIGYRLPAQIPRSNIDGILAAWE